MYITNRDLFDQLGKLMAELDIAHTIAQQIAQVAICITIDEFDIQMMNSVFKMVS